MNVGQRYTQNDYTGYTFPASGFMDVGGIMPGVHSPFKVARVFGWPDPATWALRAKNMPGDVYEIGNEPNIETTMTPQQYATYASRCHDGAPGLRKVTAGISPNGAHMPWYQVCDALAFCEYLGAHVYGPTLDALVSLTNSILAATSKPIIISELNFGPGADVHLDRTVWARIALRPYLLDYVRTQPRIKCVLYFADTWNADIPIGTPVDSRDTQIVDVLAEAANLATDWNIGTGFKKVQAQLGWTPLENEVYHFEGNPNLKASMAVFDLGHATWDPRSNETVAIDNNGNKWSDGGNRPYEPDGRLVKLGRAS